ALTPEWSTLVGEWGAREVTTRDPWNYALALDAAAPERSLGRIVRAVPAAKGAPAFAPELLGMPVRELLVAKGRRVAAWRLDRGMVAPLQASPVRVEGQDELLSFAPMGACYVRMTAFPVLGEGKDAHDWTAPALVASASHVHDLLLALHDGVLPANSADTKVARFTWWDHVGTVEWVAYDSA